MQHEWIMAGFGGQGILFLGDIVARAAMRQGLQTTYMPTYGVAMRGGTANCVVRLADEEIGSPLFEAPDAAVILNQQSFDKFMPVIRSGGLIVANDSIIDASRYHEQDNVRVVWVPATQLARECAGTERATNMVALGAFLAADSTIQAATIDSILDEERNPAKKKLVEVNRVAIKAGIDHVKMQ